jgi:hydrogenase expression/formation protein HypE
MEDTPQGSGAPDRADGAIWSGPACPIPIQTYPVVTLAHGGGGRLTRQLIDKMFRSAHDNPWMDEQHDGALLAAVPEGQVPAFTTDSFVVSPLFFPGGDIGKLAVCGTVNDLAMTGAVPRYLSCAFVIEEGFAMDELWRVVHSMAETAKAAGVQIVTGDTKVVARGQADRLYVNTAGVGYVPVEQAVRPSAITQGDVILLNGDVGRHGIAIMASREGLEFETPIESDCAPLNRQTRALLDAGIEVHALRDLTRGGLATACVELCRSDISHPALGDGHRRGARGTRLLRALGARSAVRGQRGALRRLRARERRRARARDPRRNEP